MTTLEATREITGTADSPTVWGLSAAALHDAYWRSRGVHCVRRGRATALCRGTELYLLLEPAQLVLFNLTKLTERLVWRNAAVMRLRIVDHEDEYHERVVTDHRGAVERIERRYVPRTRSAQRVILTPRRRLAEIWMSSANAREGWDRIRRSVTWSRVDHWRCPGGCFTQEDREQEAALVGRLVATWPRPGQALVGIHEARPGVWAEDQDAIAPEALVVGPAWVGRGGIADPQTCLVGPTWLPDRPVTSRQPARIREISEVEPAFSTSRDAPEETRSGYAFAKRAFDIVFSGAALALCLPVFGLVALGIVIEDGRPVFYSHVRQARGGRLFRCWKFRTMYRDADGRKAEFADRNLCDGPQVFIRNDPRITRIGHWLRRYQIDEMPQFWNVLIGQMSIVGPRPSPDDENQYCPPWREARLSVRPGITGLWQLKRTRAPGEDFQEWIKYDIEYVHRASFAYDLWICLCTAWMLLLGSRSK